MKHENSAPAPKNVVRKTSVKPQSAPVQVAFWLNVPPVTLPRSQPTILPLTPGTTVAPWFPVVSQEPGLAPPMVVNAPLSRRVSVYEPSLFFLTWNVRRTTSFAHGWPHEPLSVVVIVKLYLPCLLDFLSLPGSAMPVAVNERAVMAATASTSSLRMVGLIPLVMSRSARGDPARWPNCRRPCGMLTPAEAARSRPPAVPSRRRRASARRGVIPRLASKPRTFRKRPGSVLGVLERRRVARRRADQVLQRFARDCRAAPARARSLRRAP